MRVLRFIGGCIKVGLSGRLGYRLWLAFLAALMVLGAVAYSAQVKHGLIVTNMRDQVSWGFYIGNFTFLVGVAAAAVMLVIPAYIYRWGPIREVAILGEILAVCAILMAMCFVMLDLGRPERWWHLLPLVGLHFPASLLAWDTLVLTGYLILNAAIVGGVLWSTYRGRKYNQRLMGVLIILSIPAAISIHTVTAFLYNGLSGRPFWNASILAPRFLASAFCSGPAILIIVFQILRRTTRFRIQDEAIWKVAELMAYAMAVNLFLLGAEVFKEFYLPTEHVIHIQYLFFGVDGHDPLVPYAWFSLVCSVLAFVLLLLPKTRRNAVTLNLGCVLIYLGVYVEKGMGLVVPGFTPDTLGEIYEYVPSWREFTIGAAIFAFGFFAFTVLTKIANAILSGDLRLSAGDSQAESPHGAAAEAPSAPSG